MSRNPVEPGHVGRPPTSDEAGPSEKNMPLPRPGSYQELVARANASSCLVTDQSSPPATTAKPKKLAKRAKALLKALKSLPRAEQEKILKSLLTPRG